MSSNFLPMIAQRILNRPLLVHPLMADAIYAILEGRITADGIATPPRPDSSRFVGTYDRGENKGRRRYTKAAGKTAIVTIDGSLVNRGAWVGADMCTGLVSYEGIAAQLDEVAADARTGHLENLVLDMNSYGGEAFGMAALAAKVRTLRKIVHVVAVVNDVAASAGYGIVSGADRIVVSSTSMVGSIGVVMMHLDRSGELSAKGIRPTLIHAGAKKVDGNPFGPLPENVRADMQRDVLAFYDQFLGTVEAGRGKQRLSVKKARETEADTFIGQEAIAAGLADDLGSLDEVLAELSRPVRAAGNSKAKGAKMDREDLPGTNAGATETSLRAARLDGETAGKVVGKAEGKAEGHVEGRAEGVTAERTRIQAILSSDEAKARPNAAMTLAFDAAALSAETAKATLAALPAETGTPAAGKPAAAIPSVAERANQQQEIGANAPAQAEPAQARAGWGKAVAAVNKRFG